MLQRTKTTATALALVVRIPADFRPCPALRSSRRFGRATSHVIPSVIPGLAFLLSSTLCLPAAAQTVPQAPSTESAPTEVLSSGAPIEEIRPGELLQDRFNRRTTIPGTRIGPVLFQPSAVADLGFNDNVFAQNTGVKSDFFADYGGRLEGDYQTGTLRAHLSLNGQERHYFSLTNEDYWQAGARLSLSDQLASEFGTFFQGGVQRLAVPRTDPNDINGFKPATYLLYDAESGIAIGNGAHDLVTITAGFNQTVFDQAFGSQGQIITNDRDRQEIFGDIRYDHVFFGQQKVFAEIRPDGRDFGRDIDSAGFRRASNGVRADTGVVFDIDNLFLLSISGGYQTQDYADPRYGRITEPDATVDLLWSPSGLTQVDIKYVHEYFEDLFIESPGYVHDTTTLTVSHELRRNLLLKADVSYDARDLQRSVRHYDIITTEGRADYSIIDGLTVGVDYTFQNLTSNTTRTFDDNILMLTLKKQF